MKAIPSLIILLLAAACPTIGQALTVTEEVTPASVAAQPGEYSVTVEKTADGLLAFTVIRRLAEPRHLSSHLRIRNQDRTIAEIHTPSLSATGHNTFRFSILPEHLTESTFQISESTSRDGTPLPGTVIHRIRIKGFVPENLLEPAAAE